MAAKADIGGGIVYLATNLVNGKVYVGQTVILSKRITQHLCESRHSPKVPFHRAIAKYGRDNFTFEEIGTAVTQEELNNLEAVWILSIGSHRTRVGYNRRLGGGGSSCCEETRRLQSLAKKGKPSPKKGTKVSPEVRARMTEANRNTAARRPKKEVPPKRKRGPHTEEAKRKMSAASKSRGGPWKNGMPQEVRDKLIAAAARKRALRPPTPPKAPKEPKSRVPVSDEARRHMSESAKKNPNRYWLGKKRADNAERNRRIFTGRPSHNAGVKRGSSMPLGDQQEIARLHLIGTPKAQIARIVGHSRSSVRWLINQVQK